jgi:hypothetical protein
MNVVVKVSNSTMGASIHAPSCRVVANRGPRDLVFPMFCEDPRKLAADWDQENDVEERKIPPTKICGCTADRESAP